MLIDLGKGRQTVIDAADYPRVANFSWHQASTGYARSQVRGSRRKQCVYLHRLIMDAPVGMEVDHIDGDPLNNHRVNLRLVTHSENQQNRRGPTCNNRSGFRGVGWDACAGRYKARVVVQGKQICLGYFDQPEDASQAAEAGRQRYMTHAKRAM